MKKTIRKTLNIVFAFMMLLVTLFPTIKAEAATDYYINSKAAAYHSCTIKTAPNEGGTYLIPGVIHWLDAGDRVTMVDGSAPVPSSNSLCSTSYYNVTYNGYAGYVCGDYIEFNAIHTYDQYFKDLGFTDLYLPYLNNLKTLHPTWNFKAIKTGVDWNTAVDNESQLGVSLINTTNDGWRSTAPGSYNYYTNTFSDNFDGKGWFAASRDIVAYYMDPRNFLNVTDVFMFQTLKYDGTQNEDVVRSILNGTFMSNPYTDTDGLVKNYANTFMTVGSDTGVSPYLLASRVKQEVGNYSNSVTGTVPGYENYFNYFNINAYAVKDSNGNIVTDAITNGLNYAKLRGWNTRYGSILGGAQILGSGYINQGQDTLYSQKWDMVGDLYSHQYMTNIMAPKSEGRSIYNAYSSLGILEAALTFNIPVYENMPATSIALPSTANPNNYLKTLSINNAAVVNFDGANTEYTYYAPAGTTSITIDATTISTNASILGKGNIALPNKEQTVTVRVTAQNGAIKDYHIKVVKADGVAVGPSVTELANSLGIKNNGTYMSGIALGTNVNVVADKVRQLNNLATVTIKNANGEPVSNVSFATGDKVIISSNNETKEYTIIMYGDANGDGTVGIADLLRVQKKILNQIDLSEPYVKALDVNHDNKVDISDLLKVQKKILGISEIEQVGGIV